MHDNPHYYMGSAPVGAGGTQVLVITLLRTNVHTCYQVTPGPVYQSSSVGPGPARLMWYNSHHIWPTYHGRTTHVLAQAYQPHRTSVTITELPTHPDDPPGNKSVEYKSKASQEAVESRQQEGTPRTPLL